MRVYIIDTGKLHYDKNVAYFGCNPATKSNPNPDVQWYAGPTYCVLIEHPTKGWILFDMGTNPKYNEMMPKSIVENCYHEMNESNTIDRQLGKLGLKPEDIKHVIISHMHNDHIGNIHLFNDTAEFYVSKVEAEHAFKIVMGSLDPEKHGAYWREDVLAPMKKLNYIEEEGEIMPGIEAVFLPGHTPGFMGILIRMKKNNIFVVSDALAGRLNYEGYRHAGTYDTVSWSKSLQKIKMLEKKYDAELWFGHDAEQFERLKKIPQYYE